MARSSTAAGIAVNVSPALRISIWRDALEEARISSGLINHGLRTRMRRN
jgi:hypothetical protein